MVSPKPHLLDFSIHGHFEGEEHILALVTQTQAPESIHTPRVNVLVTRQRTHAEETSVDRRHSAAGIEIVPTEQCCGYLLRRTQLADFWSEAEHAVAPGEHVPGLCGEMEEGIDEMVSYLWGNRFVSLGHWERCQLRSLFVERTSIIFRVYYSAIMHIVAFDSPFKIMQNDPPAAMSTIRPNFSAPNKCLGV